MIIIGIKINVRIGCSDRTDRIVRTAAHIVLAGGTVHIGHIVGVGGIGHIVLAGSTGHTAGLRTVADGTYNAGTVGSV